MSIGENLAAINSRIAAAAARSGRDPSDVKLVAVSKTHSSETVREAIAAGMNVFGENKVQEAEGKINEIDREDAEWHLIGHLQSNKARRAVQLFDVIESVDSLELARRLERICEEERCEKLSVFVEVDLAGEETKSGVAESELPELADYLQSCKRLSFDGLMIVPPYFEDSEKTRPFFRRLREIRDGLGFEGDLSMGMSHDFEIAIEEGAAIVRVGTALFGEREYGQ